MQTTATTIAPRISFATRSSALDYVFDVDLFHWWEPDAPHNEAAWALRISGALQACDNAGWTASLP